MSRYALSVDLRDGLDAGRGFAVHAASNPRVQRS